MFREDALGDHDGVLLILSVLSQEFRIDYKADVGDLLVFDNRTVLHGRPRFELAPGGGRWLRGCYVEKEDLFSSYRLAARKKQALEKI